MHGLGTAPRIRPVTISPHRGRQLTVVDYPEGVERPLTRADCVGGPRPCPFVSCRYHLYIDVTRQGGLKMNFPDRQPEDMVQSCALDVADSADEMTLEEVALLMNLTRERVRQLVELTVKAILLETRKRDLVDLRECDTRGGDGPTEDDDFYIAPSVSPRDP